MEIKEFFSNYKGLSDANRALVKIGLSTVEAYCLLTLNENNGRMLYQELRMVAGFDNASQFNNYVKRPLCTKEYVTTKNLEDNQRKKEMIMLEKGKDKIPEIEKILNSISGI